MITVPNHCFTILDRYVFPHSFISSTWGRYHRLPLLCFYPSELALWLTLFFDVQCVHISGGIVTISQQHPGPQFFLAQFIRPSRGYSVDSGFPSRIL